jgi:leader peptidase HopD
MHMQAITLCFIFLYCLLTLLLAWQDATTGLLPDRLTCPLLWSGLLFHLVIQPERLATSVLGAMTGYCSLAALYWLYRGIRHQEGLGYGDVKFFAALGAWLEWQKLPMLITLATGLALLFVCLVTLAQRSGRALKNPLRFGPFLSAAGLISGWQSWINLLL